MTLISMGRALRCTLRILRRRGIGRSSCAATAAVGGTVGVRVMVGMEAARRRVEGCMAAGDGRGGGKRWERYDELFSCRDERRWSVSSSDNDSYTANRSRGYTVLLLPAQHTRTTSLDCPAQPPLPRLNLASTSSQACYSPVQRA